MEWDAKQYDKAHDFVFKYGNELLSYLPKTASQVLDIGCGTGELTNQIAKLGHKVVGIDQSQNMIDVANQSFPAGTFICDDVLTHPFADNHYDVVFSNAVFHWINDQERLTSVIHSTLKSGGQLICEFGGFNNIKAISDAFGIAAIKQGYDYQVPFYFPRVETYVALLKEQDFEIIQAYDYDRPTTLKGGREGLRNWVKQFFAADVKQLNDTEAIYQQMERDLDSQLWKRDHWEADYRRIRVIAQKKLKND